MKDFVLYSYDTWNILVILVHHCCVSTCMMLDCTVDITAKLYSLCVFYYAWIYGAFHKKLYEIGWIPWKFRADSVWIPQSFCAASHGIAVLLPRRVSPISSEWYFAVRGFVLTMLMSLFFVERLYCIQIWCTSFALVASNNGLITDT